MDDIQLSTTLLYLAGAIVLCGVSILALGAFVGINRHFKKWMLALVNPLILVIMAAGTVLSKRDITNAEFEIATAGGDESAALIWLLRLATLTVVGICLACFISASQRRESQPRQGRALLLAFLFFYFTNSLLNDIFGLKPAFDQKLIYPTLVFIAAYLNRKQDFTPMIDASKWGLLLFILASCAAIVLFPQAAVQQNYSGGLPSVHIRLWGLGSNPNSTGPLALALLLLQAYRPFRSRVLQTIGYGAGFFVLVMAQSKTAWIAALIAFPTLWWGNMLYGAAPGAHSRDSAYSIRHFARPILACLIGLGGIVALSYITIHDPLTSLAHDEQVTSLTGRTDIWAAAIETWKQSPLFGYGSSIWDVDFRRMVGMDYAYNAHNQLLQSLSMAGILGLLGLLIYCFLLLRYAYAANTATRGLSLALFFAIFARFFTEVPLNMSSIFSGEFVTHLLLFSVVLTKGKMYRTASPPGDYAPLQNLQWR